MQIFKQRFCANIFLKLSDIVINKLKEAFRKLNYQQKKLGYNCFFPFAFKTRLNKETKFLCIGLLFCKLS